MDLDIYEGLVRGFCLAAPPTSAALNTETGFAELSNIPDSLSDILV